MNAAVFLDRDNTIIENDGDLGDPAQVKLVRGAAAVIGSLRGLGYKIVVVTNQGGVARGKYKEADVEAVHRRIGELVQTTSGAKIDRFFYCPYHPEGKIKRYRREHPWRKPQPGMLREAARVLDLDLSRSWLIGDQKRDIAAGAAAGVRTVHLRHVGAPREDDEPSLEVRPDFVVDSLTEAARIIAQQQRPLIHEDLRTEVETRRAILAETRSSHVPTEPAADGRALPVAPVAPAAEELPVLDAAVVEEEDVEVEAEPAEVRSGTGEPSSPPAEQTLRQILQELRHQRDEQGEFSLLHVVAILVQVIAGLCLVAALWMGSADVTLFDRWLSLAVLAQLVTIALLLFRR